MAVRTPTAVACLVASSLVGGPFITSAQAQDCAEGRERVEGRCCWPGQSWSLEHGRCEGLPECPSELVEHGESCVGAVMTAPGSGYGSVPSIEPGEAPSIASSTAGWPSAHGAEDAPGAWAIAGRGEDEGLITAAFAVFDLGWALGWIGGFLNEWQTGGSSWVLSGIPLAGAMIGAFVDFGPSRGFSGFGLAFMLPIAFANETSETVFQPVDFGGDVTASLELSAPGSDAGASVRIGF